MRFKSPLGATGKANSSAANRTISRKQSLHTFLSIWMLVDLMTKECQKVKHQLETRLLTVLYIQHPSNHSLRMSLNTIA